MHTFTANRLTSENTLFPDRLEIDDEKIIYYKGHIFGHKTTTIPRNNVASVSSGNGLLFGDIIIESTGGKRINASGFKKSDVKMIVDLLT